MDCVVKIYATHTEPNYSLPWSKIRQYSSTSSGFIIDSQASGSSSGRLVLTNAHSVEHATQVKVKLRDHDEKFLAQVVCIANECDLALLSVSDSEFWSDPSRKVRLGSLPRLQDSVIVVGYPIGGDSLSVTSGVVSRIEVTAYAHGASKLLTAQIDAAINSGNSGGPVFSSDGECVGVAFQSLKSDESENIGYIIPTPVVNHFIRDYEKNKTFTGFPTLGLEWQKMENPMMRASYGMKPEQKGVRVVRVQPTMPASKFLKEDDVVLALDKTPVSNDGTVSFRPGERIAFSHVLTQKYVGEKVEVKVLQAGAIKTFQIPLVRPIRLIPDHVPGEPSYLIVAGIVFTITSAPYLKSEYGKDWDYDAPVKLLDRYLHHHVASSGEQVVVIGQVLAADINVGYEDMTSTQVKTFNRQPFNNLKELVKLINESKDDFLRFDCEYGKTVVLERKQAHEATADILKTHGIAHDRSADLRT